MSDSSQQLVWLAVADQEEVGDHLLACDAGKLRLVLFRKKDGQPVALRDECWHKYFPLSNGTLSNDQVTCAYHGLSFDAEGRCVKARAGPPPPGACVQAFQVKEAEGHVWVQVPEA